jgi:hypothetical protein
MRPFLTPVQRSQMDRFWKRQKAQASEATEQHIRGAMTDIIHGNGQMRNEVLPNIKGDVVGSLLAAMVVKLRGIVINTTPPTDGQVLAYNSTTNQWVPSTASLNGMWAPVTTGDVDSPEIVFDDGDVVMDFIPG